VRRGVLAVLCAVLGGAAGAGIALLVDDDGGDGATRTVVQQAPLSERARAEGDTGALTAAEIYERDAAGVVFIVAEVVRQSASPFDVFPEERRGQSTGTGFVIDGRGSILTNAHVVEGAQRVRVRFGDEKLVEAEVKGRDRSTDIALLEVDPDGLDLEPLKLGRSADVNVGDPTVAIGNPFGLDRTLTTGVISAKQRQIDAPNGFTIRDVLQTDAAINPGNSGGPLINASGEVIGINSAIRSEGGGNIGIGFAVPIDTAKRILPDLREKGRVERAYLGVTTATVDPSANLRVDRGAFVEGIVPEGPADEGGLRPGDIIVRIGGKPVESSEDVAATVDEQRPGAKVKVEVVREGDRKTVDVELGRRPDRLEGG
jgi:S1-C subfamily serine protease